MMPSYYASKFFATPKFLRHWRVLGEIFATVREKIGDGKTWYRSFSPQIFSILKVFWKTEVLTTIFFAAVRQNTFDETVIHLISVFVSEPEQFWVTLVPLRIFSVPWDKKKFARKLWYPPLLSENFFLF